MSLSPRLAWPCLAALVLFAPSPSRAVYTCGDLNDTCPCGRANPYPCCGNDSNCTWLAWHEACCQWDVALPPPWPNANRWINALTPSGYQVRSTWAPVTSSIANRTAGTYGHVAWTKGLNGGAGVRVREQSCDYGGFKTREHNYSGGYFNGGFIVRGGQVQCNPGDSQRQGCGTCGSRTRGCGHDGRWNGWGSCQGAGSCSPGQRQTQACGKCGQRTRTCSGGCRWGAWSACSGQGECAPGAVDEQACCDCGQTRRTCDSSCSWSDWSECAGPDPEGESACATGAAGVCSEGRTRCVSGCLTCVQSTEPSSEVCDDLDNDCDGVADEDAPIEFGESAPVFAASVVDSSFPRMLSAGATAEAWVLFRNDGATTWKAREVSLRADSYASGERSRLAPATGWPAYDTVSVLEHDVAPGDVAAFRFPLVATDTGEIDETFSLATPTGQLMTCPEPRVRVTVSITPPESPKAALAAQSLDKPTAKEGGCATFDTCALALLALLFLGRRRTARLSERSPRAAGG